MFTPEGYWSWDEICVAVCDWTQDITLATRFPSFVRAAEDWTSYEIDQLIHQKLLDEGFAENRAELNFALRVCELWVLANFLDTFDTVLCSPSGRTMRCHPPIKAHGDAFDWWTWPLSQKKFGVTESTGYLDYFRNSNFQIADAKDRFCAIDYVTGQIKLKPNSVQLFLQSSYGHGPSDNDARRFIEEQVRPFIGWSICWNPKDIPKTKSEIYSEIGFQDVDWATFEASIRTSKIAKDTQHQSVMECLLSAYPNGKGKATWETVELKVGYSRRSIVRALKQNGLWEDWAEGGQS